MLGSTFLQNSDSRPTVSTFADVQLITGVLHYDNVRSSTLATENSRLSCGESITREIEKYAKIFYAYNNAINQ